MTKIILIVSNHADSSETLALELARILENRDNEEDIEDYDFNPRGILQKAPTDDELLESAVLLAPFTKKQLKEIAARGMETHVFTAWKDFFLRAELADKKVIPFFDFKTNRLIEPRILLQKLLHAEEPGL